MEMDMLEKKCNELVNRAFCENLSAEEFDNTIRAINELELEILKKSIIK